MPLPLLIRAEIPLVRKEAHGNEQANKKEAVKQQQCEDGTEHCKDEVLINNDGLYRKILRYRPSLFSPRFSSAINLAPTGL